MLMSAHRAHCRAFVAISEIVASPNTQLEMFTANPCTINKNESVSQKNETCTLAVNKLVHWYLLSILGYWQKSEGLQTHLLCGGFPDSSCSWGGQTGRLSIFNVLGDPVIQSGKRVCLLYF